MAFLDLLRFGRFQNALLLRGFDLLFVVGSFCWGVEFYQELVETLLYVQYFLVHLLL